LEINSFSDLDKLEVAFMDLGGNPVLAAQIAVLKALSKGNMFSFLNSSPSLPTPLGNCIEGGVHSQGGTPDFQEFLVIAPKADSFFDAANTNMEVYTTVRDLLGRYDPNFKNEVTAEGAWRTYISNFEALDILKKALSAAEDRTKSEKIFNLQIVWSDLEHTKGTVEIPESSVDLVSFINITGLILKNQIVIDNVKRVLKVGGRLVLVDWQPNSILARMLSVHKTDQAKLKQVLEQNGFHLLKSFPAGLNHFGLLFEKGQ